ncbi:MAG: hypothetical protein EHM85_02930 [Desulfobacteraceae bacterium]|nr:MAG: hypothetical protein EHM85_02930 [Desulfobacteraceae bacterium]
MPRYIILAQSHITANALASFLDLIGEDLIDNNDKRRIIWEDNLVGLAENKVLAYKSLIDRIFNAATLDSDNVPLNDVMILVDSVNLKRLNPVLNDGAIWNSLIAMLILTFPEIKWLFGNYDGNRTDFPMDDHALHALFMKPLRDPLFDATGLRNFIRKNAKIDLPDRKECAAAIDEELSYSYFHAYAAYRFGYRADAVRSWALMENLFGDEGKDGHGFSLLLEDVNLNFPDKLGNNDFHLSNFEVDRAKQCPLLKNINEKSKFRIIVTSGYSGIDSQKLQHNKNYVKSYKPKGFGYVQKPVGGLFDLWTRAGLFKRLIPGIEEKVKRQRGYAPSFYWPHLNEKDQINNGHSAPGIIMLIAQNLLCRADNMRNSSNTVEECIRGAVLANDALELLCYKTPTLSLQALSLKHEFEARAEVAFLGVGHHFDLSKRFEELMREVAVASRFFEKNLRKASELDALVGIGNRLMLVFREAGQFDEELKCLAKIRSWHRFLRFKQAANPFDFIASLFMGYAEWLMAKPANFIVMLIIWFVAFWGLWFVNVNINDLWGAASSAWNAFICANPGEPKKDTPELALNIIASGMGLFHLGVFISYLYSAIVRK